MKKLILFTFLIIFVISCKPKSSEYEAILNTNEFIFLGQKEIPIKKNENVVVDRFNKDVWLVKYSENGIFMRHCSFTNLSKNIQFYEGEIIYLYNSYLYDQKFITRAVIDNCSYLVVFDLCKEDYQKIRIDEIGACCICGFNNKFIYLYSYDDFLLKIDCNTQEKTKVNCSLQNPGYCAETDTIIGMDENRNICTLKDDTFIIYPIKGVSHTYESRLRYIDINSLYYNTENKIWYAKKDILGCIKSICNFTFFLDGLDPVIWYSFDKKTGKSKKVKTKGNVFLLEK